MTARRYTVDKFIKLCNEVHPSIFIFSSENLYNPDQYMRFGVGFSKVKTIPRPAVGTIEFYDDSGNFMLFENITSITVGENIPGFGSSLTITCGDGCILEHKKYNFIMR